MKTLGIITAHINIEKLNERGKKMLNAKLKRHLTIPHTLSYEVSTYIYIYIYIYDLGFLKPNKSLRLFCIEAHYFCQQIYIYFFSF